MTGDSFDRTTRGDAVRIENIEIVPVIRITGHVGAWESGVWGGAGVELVQVEIVTPQGTTATEL